MRDELRQGGSSPLTRGALDERADNFEIIRLIPAHAGSTVRRCARRGHGPAHPRSRGEHISQNAPPIFDGGSSPLTRGARQDAQAAATPRGLIPAHAGSTISSGQGGALIRAHPRSRGEHWAAKEIDAQSIGSSPLTRGAPNKSFRQWSRKRLIPAHAGSTVLRTSARLRRTAHPRSRGEHDRSHLGQIAFNGSSPLTRGARPLPRKRP